MVGGTTKQSLLQPFLDSPNAAGRAFNPQTPQVQSLPMAGKYLLTTLGCKVNQYESQQIREVLESLGLRPARRGDAPDVAVVNTCAVTAGAQRKTRQMIRRAVHRGSAPVVVVGCAATADAQRLRKLAGVAAVLGHGVDVCAELRNFLADFLGVRPAQPPADAVSATHNRSDVNRNDVSIKPGNAPRGKKATSTQAANPPIHTTPPIFVVKTSKTLTGRIEAFAGHQRAFLKVQDGCDAFCTYCIIPQLRPDLRSKPIEEALAEARDLVRAGHKEIIVTGIFLGAYGRETALRKRWLPQRSPLAALVDALARVEGLQRLRLSSLEPGDVDEALLDVLAAHRACVPHLHLPLQSGSPKILQRMNRQYTVDAFVDVVDRVRAVLDQPAISTDIIVGFPGEDEHDFQASLEVVRCAEFCKIHAFPFSPRDKTAAARWQQDFVHPTVVRERMHRLADVERECSLSFRRRFVGEVERVIVEGPPRFDKLSSARHYLDVHRNHGRADRYFEIHFETPGLHNRAGCADRVHPGDLVTVRIDRVTPTLTHGTLLRPNADSYPLCVLSAAAGS